MTPQHIGSQVLNGVLSCGLLALLSLASPDIGQAQGQEKAAVTSALSITLTSIPLQGSGGDRDMATIAGTVHGENMTRYKIVIYAHTDKWYVQPYVASPFTAITPNGTWQSRIHLGREYAVLLVDDTYKPSATTFALPDLGGGVIAISKVAGQ